MLTLKYLRSAHMASVHDFINIEVEIDGYPSIFFLMLYDSLANVKTCSR